jgi:hypothetical protein
VERFKNVWIYEDQGTFPINAIENLFTSVFSNKHFGFKNSSHGNKNKQKTLFLNRFCVWMKFKSLSDQASRKELNCIFLEKNRSKIKSSF